MARGDPRRGVGRDAPAETVADIQAVNRSSRLQAECRGVICGSDGGTNPRMTPHIEIRIDVG